VKIVRLTAGDPALANAMFMMKAAVFDQACDPLADAYVVSLLRRADFWAIAAIDGTEVVGGVTAHTLPMTRAATSEMFIYDLAVRTDRQREGIGRQLIAFLREAAAREGIDVVFVPADNEDTHALDFYLAVGATASPVTFFTFEP
jgi:aminoglycoside 3-N-acetyltransferase I